MNELIDSAIRGAALLRSEKPRAATLARVLKVHRSCITNWRKPREYAPTPKHKQEMRRLALLDKMVQDTIADCAKSFES